MRRLHDTPVFASAYDAARADEPGLVTAPIRVGRLPLARVTRVLADEGQGVAVGAVLDLARERRAYDRSRARIGRRYGTPRRALRTQIATLETKLEMLRPIVDELRATAGHRARHATLVRRLRQRALETLGETSDLVAVIEAGGDGREFTEITVRALQVHLSGIRCDADELLGDLEPAPTGGAS